MPVPWSFYIFDTFGIVGPEGRQSLLPDVCAGGKEQQFCGSEVIGRFLSVFQDEGIVVEQGQRAGGELIEFRHLPN